MKFSVIIPVYNGERFINKSIQSILDQTYSDWELIVVDDGSVDGTSSVVNEIIKSNPTKKIVLKTIPNSGPSTARNVGMDSASGDYICFLDSDDGYKKQLFSDLANTLQGEDICFFGWEEYDEATGKLLSRYEDSHVYPDKPLCGTEAAVLKFKNKIWLCNCNEVYSLNFLKEQNIRYMEGVYSGEDSNFIYKSLLNARQVISLKGDYFINITRSDSLMHSAFSLRSLTGFDAGKDLYGYAVDNNFEDAICDMFFTHYYTEMIYVAKRIARSLKWYQGVKFAKLCKKYIPKIKKERNLVFSKKDKKEHLLFKSKLIFFLVYKFFVYKKTK